jgi:aspartyl-tRNA(Asn)/glutamyl-tRNA(Gln) amidotransferase subunit A
MKKDLESCLEIVAAVKAHEVTARSVVDTALAKAEKFQDQWRSFITITPELAREQAERVDSLLGMGRKLPLAGVPFAVKDLFDVKGVPTTCGSKAFADRKPEVTATAVAKLQAAGAVLIGKLNMHECAFGFTGENPTYGDCKNPWDPKRIAGGSSSGSATAIVLGICPFSLGSDTGGSIRLPSALCNLVGLKPTYGRVSRAGAMPLSWTMDHVGPMARTAAEAALVLEVMAGQDSADQSSSARPVPQFSSLLDAPGPAAKQKLPLAGIKIGWPKTWFFDSVAPEVDVAVRAAVEKLVALGAAVVEVELPHLEEVIGAHRAILFPEASSSHQQILRDNPGAYGDGIRSLLQAGLLLSAVDYLQGQRVRRVVRKAWAKVFAGIDCLVTPSSPILASHFGDQTARLPDGEKPLVRAYLDQTCPFNLTGHPALSMPCGFSQDKLPIGMQLVGKPFADSMILRIAHQYQKNTAWHDERPTV